MLITIDINDTSINIQDYTAIDISRTVDDTNINITNTTGNFAFNSIFNALAYHLPGPLKFTIQADEAFIIFDNLTVSYHLNTETEILHFARKNDLLSRSG